MWFVISEDPAVSSPLARNLSARGLPHVLVDATDGAATPSSWFDRALEAGAEGVLFVERLARAAVGPGPRAVVAERPAGDEAGHGRLRDALAAANAPGIHAFGWITSRPPDDPEIQRLRRLGLPYGVLRVGPVFAVREALGPGRSSAGAVLVETGLAEALAGATSVDALAERLAEFLAGEEPGEGRVSVVEPPATPLEDALRSRGLRPTLLSAWRVGLNAFFGLPLVTAGEADGEVLIERRPFRPRAARERPEAERAKPRQGSRDPDRAERFAVARGA